MSKNIKYEIITRPKIKKNQFSKRKSMRKKLGIQEYKCRKVEECKIWNVGAKIFVDLPRTMDASTTKTVLRISRGRLRV